MLKLLVPNIQNLPMLNFIAAKLIWITVNDLTNCWRGSMFEM